MLDIAFKEIVAQHIPINVTSSSSKSEIRSNLKLKFGDLSSIDMTKQFITQALSPITILELFNRASQTFDILPMPFAKRRECL